MKISQTRLLLFLCTSIAFISCHTQNTETPSVTPPTDFHGIPPKGIGGDSLLNMEKNRWVASGNFTDVSVSDIIGFQHDILSAMGTEDRYRWTAAAKSQATVSELQGVRLTGYITAAKEEGNESCNGNNDNYHDFHIWITGSAGEDKTKSIVVEATPFWREQFSGWQLTKFEQLVSQNAQVRISGWIMWDEDHPEQIGSSRASLWEIHPITKFEYFSGGIWQTL
jgi:hypothetical protein